MPMSQARKEFLIKEISRLHRKHLSNGQIASELDCSIGFVSDHTRPCDLKYKVEHQATREIKRVEKFEKMLAEGSTVKEALRAVGGDRNTIKKYQKWYHEGGKDRIVEEIMATYKRVRKSPHNRKSEQITTEYMEHLPLWNHVLYGKELRSHAA